MAAFLDTVNVEAVAMILAVVIEMSRISLQNWRTILIAVASLLITFYFKKLNTAFVVLGGSLAVYLLTLLP